MSIIHANFFFVLCIECSLGSAEIDGEQLVDHDCGDSELDVGCNSLRVDDVFVRLCHCDTNLCNANVASHFTYVVIQLSSPLNEFVGPELISTHRDLTPVFDQDATDRDLAWFLTRTQPIVI